MNNKKPSPTNKEPIQQKKTEKANELNNQVKEVGGQEGPDPTRYGDWEKGGRCTDF